ncbi:MAG TPA: hypothetical protein VKR57_12195 [Terriglobales bacterium]|nr:hypothetical protein [Terriglobales bacterium]
MPLAAFASGFTLLPVAARAPFAGELQADLSNVDKKLAAPFALEAARSIALVPRLAGRLLANAGWTLRFTEEANPDRAG